MRFVKRTRICSKPDRAVLKTQLRRITDELLKCLVDAFVGDDRKSGVLHFTVLHRFIKTHPRTSSVKATPLFGTVHRIAFRHLGCVDECSHCTACVCSKQVSKVIWRQTASLLQNRPCINTIGVLYYVPLKNVSSRERVPGPLSNIWFIRSTRDCPKLADDRFIRFCTVHSTLTQITLPVTYIAIGRIYAMWPNNNVKFCFIYLFIYLFIIKSYTKYMTDRHTVRTMRAVKAALNINSRQNVVYKITRKPCRQ